MSSRSSGDSKIANVRQSPKFKRLQRKLGTRVRELRESKGLTLYQAQERSGLDLKHWQKVEAGQLNVTLVTLHRIAEGLGVPIGELFGS